MKVADKTVVITGAMGNVGRKLLPSFIRDGRVNRIIALDHSQSDMQDQVPPHQKLDLIQSNLLDPTGSWLQAVYDADVVIHLAAQNPHTDASWEDAAASIEMTANLVNASILAPKVSRFVFASTNHVMGGYKRRFVPGDPAFGWLKSSLKPMPGTVWFNGIMEANSTVYAVGKMMAEKIVQSAAELAGGKLSCVSVRIGWVQPDENSQNSITISGDPKYGSAHSPVTERDEQTLHWFRCMWLSNRDLAVLFTAAAFEESRSWPSRSIIVNGMSANLNMPWDLTDAKVLLGYTPRDNSYSDSIMRD